MLPTQLKALFTVTNCICFDQRVLKMAEVISSLGVEITIAGRRRGTCCDRNLVLYRTRRFRMIFNRGFLFYMSFNIRLFFFLLFRKADFIVANDLDTLLPCFLVSRIRGLPLVYDSHEYFTGLPELTGRPFVRNIWKRIEKSTMPGLKNVITVSDGIADEYLAEYGHRPVVIRNLSRKSDHLVPVSRETLGIPEDALILVMQGTGINVDKGAAELIDALDSCPDTWLLIVGSGDLLPDLRKRAASGCASGRILFISTLPWEEMMRYTKCADIGLCLEKDTNINYRYSLPNKLFDYISAGLPVIAGNLPEIAGIITGNSCGIIIPAVTADEISQAVNHLSNNRELLGILKRNSREASLLLNWEEESSRVRDFYSSFMNQNGIRTVKDK